MSHVILGIPGATRYCIDGLDVKGQLFLHPTLWLRRGSVMSFESQAWPESERREKEGCVSCAQRRRAWQSLLLPVTSIVSEHGKWWEGGDPR